MSRNLPAMTDAKFHKLLWACGHQCEHTTWDDAAIKRIRCDRLHLGPQQEGRKGKVQLTAVMSGQGVLLFCQQHVFEVMKLLNPEVQKAVEKPIQNGFEDPILDP